MNSYHYYDFINLKCRIRFPVAESPVKRNSILHFSFVNEIVIFLQEGAKVVNLFIACSAVNFKITC